MNPPHALPDPGRINFRLLHYFRVVAEEMNFTQAARRLNMSQPPLSKHIKELESQLGVVLFKRTTRSMTLTPAGRTLLRNVERLLDQADSALHQVQQMGRGEGGHMVVGSASRTRDFRLGDGGVGINGAIWDMNRIDVQAQQGTWERWNIHADTPQSFHIQGVQFLIKRVNGAQPMAEDRGWKDTVWVDGDVELLVYFNQPTSEHFPFLYYSQTLEMADRGTAGQLMVQPTM